MREKHNMVNWQSEHGVNTAKNYSQLKYTLIFDKIISKFQNHDLSLKKNQPQPMQTKHLGSNTVLEEKEKSSKSTLKKISQPCCGVSII